MTEYQHIFRLLLPTKIWMESQPISYCFKAKRAFDDRKNGFYFAIHKKMVTFANKNLKVEI